MAASNKPVLFHSRCGKYAAVENGGVTARRTRLSEFNHAVVVTNVPLKDNQLFEVEVTRLTDRWAGSVEVGLTTHAPDKLEFPPTMTNMTSGTWMISGKGVIRNRSNIKRNLSFDLDSLTEGQRVGVMRKEGGAMVLFINGEEVEIVATEVPPNVYGVVDLYGQCVSVKLTAPAPPTALPTPRQATTSAKQTDGNRLVPGTIDPVAFHSRCGENVEIGPDKRSASRPQPYQEFTRATVFTDRPLNPDEWFEVTVRSAVECWSGSLQMGVTLESPDSVELADVDEAADIKKAWVLSGSELFNNCQVLTEDYCLDLDDVPLGGRVAVCVTSSGQLHFALNGVDLGCAVENVPQGVHGVVDIYGNCSRVIITKFTLADETSVSIIEPTPTAQKLSTRPGEAHKFHTRVGEMVRLSSDNMKATRTGSFTDAVVFSADMIAANDLFEVELVSQDNKWIGPLKIGLTSCDPSLLPSLPPLSSQLPANTWIVSRSSVYHNGKVIRENYSHRLLRMSVGDHVGVQRRANGTMHIILNGEDLGAAAQGITETTYAVVDVYGSAKSIMVTSKASPSQLPLPVSPGYSLVNPPIPPLTTVLPPVTLSIRLSRSCGSCVRLRANHRSAYRTKSSSHSIVLTATTIPDYAIFEVEIKRLNSKWHGSLAIGMTTVYPSQACLESNATDLIYNTLVISGNKVYVDGQEQSILSSGVSLDKLVVGDRVGLMSTPENFVFLFINGEELEKLQYHPVSEKYGLVDLFGQCDEVLLRPLTLVPVPFSAISDNDNMLESRKKKSKRGLTDISVALPLKNIYDSCEYFQLSQQYLRVKLALPDVFFDPTPSYNMCYCSNCSPQTEEVRKQGDPPQTYTLPLGWIKFALRVPPQALALDIFNKWHVAYYGTTPGRVRKVLDSGQLISPEEFALGEGHIQRLGANGETDEVFLTPSIRYCTMGKEYAKWDEFRDAETNRKYRVQVAFKLCVQPNSYHVRPQSNSEPLDLHLSNSELAWQTMCGGPVYLCGLLVRLCAK